MIYDVDKMLVCTVIGSLVMLVGGIIVLLSVIENQTPTLGTYVMMIGILIVVVGSLSIMIFENIKRWIKNLRRADKTL